MHTTSRAAGGRGRTATPRVLTGTALPREIWRELLDSDSAAVPTQSPEWLESLTAVGGYQDASRLYEMPDGRRALLPLVRRSYLRGGPAILHSMPRLVRSNPDWRRRVGGLPVKVKHAILASTLASSLVYSADDDAVFAALIEAQLKRLPRYP